MTSIRRKLVLALLGAISLAQLLGALAFYRGTLEEVGSLFDYQLRQFALSVRDQAFHNSFAPPVEEDEEGFDFVIQVWNPEGVRLYYSHPHRTLPGLAQESGYATIDTPEGAWRVFSTRLFNQVIQVAQPMEVRNRMALATASHLLIPFLVLVPVLGFLSWSLVTRELRPIKKLARAVAARSPNTLTPIPEKNVPEEVMPLVRSLNDLLVRLAEAIAAQKAFIADAAHELRTPIAALQLQVQLLERALSEEERLTQIADLKSGVVRAGHAVQQLLTLARQEPDASLKVPRKVDLAQLAGQVVTDHAGLARSRSIDLGLGQVEPVSIRGETEGLRVLLANLVDNAIRYTPDGGRVDVSVTSKESRVLLQVDDSGPGIPESDRPRVFDRFYRGENQQIPGTGLGMAIVKAIADRHHAMVQLDTSELGGLSVRVLFERDTIATPDDFSISTDSMTAPAA
jgi:two-component system OmpR family sensor kinase